MGGPRRTISTERQGIYYLGMALIAIGFIVFISALVSSTRDNRSPSSFEPSRGAFSPMAMEEAIRNSKSEFEEFGERSRSKVNTALVGMGLVFVGALLMSLGRAGAAGSGLILDPQQARQDLEPWSRATGGMIADAIDEIPAIQQAIANPPPKEIVKVRCPSCKHLNDETAKFCAECGENLLDPKEDSK